MLWRTVTLYDRICEDMLTAASTHVCRTFRVTILESAVIKLCVCLDVSWPWTDFIAVLSNIVHSPEKKNKIRWKIFFLSFVMGNKIIS